MALAGLLTLGATGQALAGAFSVSPVRVFLEPRERATALTLVNGADAEVVLQADVMQWSQDGEGQDRLEPSDDLLISPPILRIGPRSRQVVRLARLVAPHPQRQLTYRLLLREVPDTTRVQEPGTRLPITLVLSIPVFIGAPGAQPEVVCELQSSQPPRVGCRNQGRAYAQIRELSLVQEGRALSRFEGALYLLPGSQRVLPLKADENSRPAQEVGVGPLEGAGASTGPARIELRLDDAKPRSSPATTR